MECLETALFPRNQHIRPAHRRGQPELLRNARVIETTTALEIMGIGYEPKGACCLQWGSASRLPKSGRSMRGSRGRCAITIGSITRCQRRWRANDRGCADRRAGSAGEHDGGERVRRAGVDPHGRAVVNAVVHAIGLRVRKTRVTPVVDHQRAVDRGADGRRSGDGKPRRTQAIHGHSRRPRNRCGATSYATRGRSAGTSACEPHWWYYHAALRLPSQDLDIWPSHAQQ